MTIETTRAGRFEWLLSPIDPSVFLAEKWERQHCIINKDAPHFFDDLITLTDLDFILTSRELHLSECRMVQEGSIVDPSSYAVNLRRHVPKVDIGKVMTLFADGATIILDGLNRCHAPLGHLCNQLESETGFRFQVNSYLTPKRAKGFRRHYDDHDVFVLQVSGRKKWRIFNAPVQLPMHRHHDHNIDLSVLPLQQEFDLTSGNAVYIPRGLVHEAEGLGEDSFHLTLGVTSETWADVLTTAVELASNTDIGFRKYVHNHVPPNRRHATEYRRTYSHLLNQLMTVIDVSHVFDELNKRYIARQRPLLDGQLGQLVRLDSLILSSEILIRPSVVHCIRRERERVVLEFSGKVLEMPAFVEPCLRSIPVGQVFRALDLDNSIDDEGKLALLRRLIKEGFIMQVCSDEKAYNK